MHLRGVGLVLVLVLLVLVLVLVLLLWDGPTSDWRLVRRRGVVVVIHRRNVGKEEAD